MPRGVKVYGVAKMETAHIACRVEANPPQVGFRWTFNNSAEAKQGRQTDRQTDLTTETLILTSESQKARSTKNPLFLVDGSNIIIQSG